VEGRFHWRSYSLSSVPVRSKGLLTITVRAMPEGFLSDHLVRGLEPGTIVRLQAPSGEFTLPDPPPEKALFLVGGSGITPVMAMLRTLDRRAQKNGRAMPDVVLHYSSPTPDRMIFRDELHAMAERHDGLTLYPLHTDHEGMFDLADLDQICPDWRERETWACGPGPMLDAVEEHFERWDRRDSLHLERFSLELGANGGEGGTITFRNSGKQIEVDGATTVLEAGEQAGVGMPFGCRMGICHMCTLRMVDGTIRDLRNGDEFGQPNEPVQTCVTAAVGDCTFDI
jgi:ferredoxin-NADP reductase